MAPAATVKTNRGTPWVGRGAGWKRYKLKALNIRLTGSARHASNRKRSAHELREQLKTPDTRATENTTHEQLKTLDTRATDNARRTSNWKRSTHELLKTLYTRATEKRSTHEQLEKTHDTRATENARHTSNWPEDAERTIDWKPLDTRATENTWHPSDWKR